MKAYGGVQVEFHTFATSVQVLDKWSPSRHVRLHLRECDSSNHWRWSWMGSKCSLKSLEKREPLALVTNRNLVLR